MFLLPPLANCRTRLKISLQSLEVACFYNVWLENLQRWYRIPLDNIWNSSFFLWVIRTGEWSRKLHCGINCWGHVVDNGVWSGRSTFRFRCLMDETADRSKGLLQCFGPCLHAFYIYILWCQEIPQFPGNRRQEWNVWTLLFFLAFLFLVKKNCKYIKKKIKLDYLLLALVCMLSFSGEASFLKHGVDLFLLNLWQTLHL